MEAEEIARDLVYSVSMRVGITNLLEDFIKINKNSDRIRHCCKLLTLAGEIPPAIDAAWMKNEYTARQARIEGNRYFKKQNFEQALLFYNQSLCFGPAGSDSLGIAYGNRSAVYFRLGFYELCLENIKMALVSGYPDKLKPKLIERKVEALKLLNNSQIIDRTRDQFQMKLSHTANPKIPFIVDGLRVERNKQLGRRVLTDKDLAPGDLIMMEPPFMKVVEDVAVYTKCHNCVSGHSLNLQPCPRATMVMFCSRKCAEEAWERSYQFEFQFIDSMQSNLPASFHCALRLVFRAFTLFGNDFTAMEHFFNAIDTSEEHGLSMDYTTASEMDKFRAFYSLTTNETKRTPENLFVFTALCAGGWTFVKHNSSFKEFLKVRQHEDFFLELLMKFSQITATNSHDVYDVIHDKGTGRLCHRKVGAGISAIYCLINHSCDRNVVRVTVDGRYGIYVVRPIKAGEEIFDNYGFQFDEFPEFVRKKGLQGGYQFECKCTACMKNFPLSYDLKKEGFLPDAILQQVLQTSNYVIRDDNLKAVITKYLGEFSHLHPCFETCVLQASLTNLIYFMFCGDGMICDE